MRLLFLPWFHIWHVFHIPSTQLIQTNYQVRRMQAKNAVIVILTVSTEQGYYDRQSFSVFYVYPPDRLTEQLRALQPLTGC